MNLSPIIRIALRYLAGAMVARGLLDDGLATIISTDAELIESLTLIAGTILGAISEGWYVFAKRRGWSK